jgi:flagellar hook-associated protein 1
MGSLNASLASALSGLTADQGALEATTNNVANVDTPGYSRQTPILVSGDPVVVAPLTFGTGVKLTGIQSIRDAVLESRVQQETQNQGQFDAQVSALQQTQVNFTGDTGDIGSAISNFFNSVNQLATNPANLSVRQGVLTSAGNLATAFNSTANQLTQQRANLDLSMVQTVDQINQFTQQIAQLNGEISNLQNVGENAGTFIDQRTQLIDQLSSIVDVSVIPSDNTLTLITSHGTALVAGQKSFQLQTQSNLAGLHDVFAQGTNITNTILSGRLGGLLQVRDRQIPVIQGNLDTLAAALANQVNAVQAGGFDLNGGVGTNLFNPPPLAGTGAAASLSVAITDPALIAASSDGSAGSNGNAQALYDLRNLPIVSGQSPTDYYSGIVFAVGNDVANATAAQGASALILQQLNSQRSSISGVSLDEEAANVVRFQQAYSASAQVVSTINQMMQTVINMKTS